MVIFATNPVHSILFLILTFCNCSFIMFLIGAEFLGLIFIMVYVGAIAVLFLFVIMMLDIKRSSSEKLTFFDICLILIVGLIFFFELFFMLENSFITIDMNLAQNNKINYINLYSIVKIKVLGGIKIIGLLLYTTYSFYLVLASLVLLVAMIGAIVLTLHKKENIKSQNDFDQINRDFQSAIFLKTLVQSSKKNI